MPKKISIALLFTVTLVTCALIAIPQANAGNEPCIINSFEEFLKNGFGCDTPYFNIHPPTDFVCDEIRSFDFEGPWKATAIGNSAANRIKFEWDDPATTDVDVVFDTIDDSNWGQLKDISFNLNSPTFTDISDDSEYTLDPYCPDSGGNCEDLKMCRLTQKSKVLTYLDNPITLPAGTYLVFLDDNKNSTRDGDFNDMVVALQPAPRTNPRSSLKSSVIINLDIPDEQGEPLTACATLDGDGCIAELKDCSTGDTYEAVPITEIQVENCDENGANCTTEPLQFAEGEEGVCPTVYLFAASSPGCTTIVSGGRAFRICR